MNKKGIAKENPEGRNCKICGAILSTHNETDICWCHSPGVHFSQPRDIDGIFTYVKRAIPKIPRY